MLILNLIAAETSSESSRLLPVVPVHKLTFPHDYGAHQDFRIEWWYITGWLETADKKPMGFQITFFRYATDQNHENPSRFAAKYLIIAHLALSDPAVGKLMHAEKSAREGFDLAYARPGNTDVKLDDWTLVREADGRYQVDMRTGDFGLRLSLSPTQMLMLQDQNGFSRKGGLCHSIQHTSQQLSEYLDIPYEAIYWRAAGINHLAWFGNFPAGVRICIHYCANVRASRRFMNRTRCDSR